MLVAFRVKAEWVGVQPTLGPKHSTITGQMETSDFAQELKQEAVRWTESVQQEVWSNPLK